MKVMMCAIFIGSGIGVLISPAFVSFMIGWNLLGFTLVGVGIMLLPKGE